MHKSDSIKPIDKCIKSDPQKKDIIMLRQIKELKKYTLGAQDGDIGKVREFYFDDNYWTIRYLVADTGGWLSGRRVLISPHALHVANEAEQVLPVDLTKQQIEESPSLASDQPVSRQYEMQYYQYYNWPMYWSGTNLWGSSPNNVSINSKRVPDQEGSKESVDRAETWDSHLRSTSDVIGHHIQAEDGEIGHVEDFIIDDETWAIRYLVVDTKNWWSGKHVLISPQWVDRVSWEEGKVFVNLSRDAIKGSPEYTEELLSRAYETELHQHYQREGYWTEDSDIKTQTPTFKSPW
jgi:uncharacterized protein YrrD